LIELKAAYSIKSYKELMNILDVWLSHPEMLIKAGKIAKEYIESKAGATNLIVDNLLKV